MARTDTLPHFLTDVANAIRTKGGTSGTIQASSFDTAIANLPSGGGLNMDYMFEQSTMQYLYFNNRTQVAVSSMEQTFGNCGTLETVDFSGLDTTGCTSFAHCFDGCTSLTGVTVDTDSATDLSEMFRDCSNLGAASVSLSDTSSATNMYGMFIGCSVLDDITGWGLDTSACTNAESMFEDCSALTDIPVLDMSSAEYMGRMFGGCYSLSTTSLDNILQMCIGATAYSGTMTLAELGIDEYTYDQATIEALDHYADFVNAGWSTGYGGGE